MLHARDASSAWFDCSHVYHNQYLWYVPQSLTSSQNSHSTVLAGFGTIGGALFGFDIRLVFGVHAVPILCGLIQILAR